MVALVITEANIDWVSGKKSTKDAAETMTAGVCLYLATTTTCGVATNNDAAKDELCGIALNAGTAGHPVTYAEDGAIVDFGAILTVGTWYAMGLSGAIDPVADHTSGDYISYVGYAITTSQMQIRLISTGLTIA